MGSIYQLQPRILLPSTYSRSELMKKYYFIFIAIMSFVSCRKNYDVQLPNTNWDQFESPSALALKDTTGKRLEGVYQISDGASAFGEQAALKWSYNDHGTDT